MQPTSPEQEEIKRIRAGIERIQKIDLGDPARFKNRPDLPILASRIKAFANSVYAADIAGIPYNYAKDFGVWFDQVANDLTELANDTLDENKLANIMVERWGVDWQSRSIFLSHSLLNSSPESLGQRLSEATKLRTDMTNELTAAKKEVGAALEEVRKLYGKAVIAKHAGSFKEEAEMHAHLSWLWLFLAVAAGIAVAVYVDHQSALIERAVVATSGPASSMALVAQVAVSKLVIVSLMTYGLVVAIRQFTAARHNVTVNKHRMNALSSFESFAQAADDKDSKAAVLLEATKAVFTPQTTGLLKHDSEPTHGTQIVEVFRNLTGKGA